MKKSFSLLLISAAAFLLCHQGICADMPLRNPQGRIGTHYKPEKYVPMTKTNISAEELTNISKLIKEEAKKTAQNKQADSIKQKQSSQKAAAKLEKDTQNKVLAEKKQATKQEPVNKKPEENKEKIASKSENSEHILSHEKPKEKQEGKLSLPIGKKENTIKDTDIKQNTVETKQETNIQNTPSDKKFTQDINTKNIVNEITTELNKDREKMLSELSTLWVSAVQKSDTVYFAIMKLSNPNGEEVNKNGFKKILEPIINAAPLVGQAFVNPALTAGSIIGSNVMGTMMNDSMKHSLAKVNDADLVILARAVDELQESLLMNYMAYKNAKEEYELAIKISDERKKEYEILDKKNSPNTILANTFYTEALDTQYKARQDFLMKRVVLEQMVGADALNEIETGKKPEPDVSAPTDETTEETPEETKSKKHKFFKKSKKK